MPDETTILSLPLILPAQAQKHVTHNEALARLDLIVQLAVISRVLTTSPALPTLGDRYIVAAGATGDWVGQAGRIALYGETGWQFTEALPGWQAHVLAEGQTAVFDGLAWVTLADGPLVVAELGVSATPDGTNRLSVSSPATLLNHAGAGHQLKLNKAAVGDTASLLFQTGFGGRAEMGTVGSDDFAVKVSADGTAWALALEAEASTGEVTLPQPVHLGGQASDPAVPVDGTLWLNSTTGEVKVRSAGVTQAIGGGGVGDGDKGDISVSSGVWTIDPGAVTLARMADMATASLIYRKSAGVGAPEVQSLATLKADLGFTATGIGILDLYSDRAELRPGVNSGTALQVYGSSATAFLGMGQSNTISYIQALSTGADSTSMVFRTANAGAEADNMVLSSTGRLRLGTGVFTSGAHVDIQSVTGGLCIPRMTTAERDAISAPANGNLVYNTTTNSLQVRAGGAWIEPPGTPGGAADELQFNNAGAMGGMAGAKHEGGQLRLPFIATPANPAAGGLKLYGMDFGPGAPAFLLPSGKVKLIQSDLGDFNIQRFTPAMGSASLVLETSLALTAIGTATAASGAVTSLHTMMPRLDLLVTTAAATAIAGWRHTGTGARGLRVGKDANAPGGFLSRTLWSPATGVSNTTHRGFAGLCDWGNTAPTDVQPSSRTNVIGMGWDAADANIQFMHNDGSGTATKIDLGASFPVPTTDRAAVYEVQLYSPNSLTQSVSYRVIRYDLTDKTIAAEATGTVTSDLPTVTTLLGVGGAISAGGTSSVVGVALMGILVAREY